MSTNSEAQPSSDHTMRTFVSRALVRIQKEASGRRFATLRDVCQGAIDRLARETAPNPTAARAAAAAKDNEKDDEDLSEASHDSSARDAQGAADLYFEPFRLACDSKMPKLMEVSLDCIQKLIAYGYLRGSMPAGDPEHPEKMLMDVVIETIFSCGLQQDDPVQLQVIKALLTAVTSSTCDVHGNSLLQAVRMCYRIHLMSKSLVNQTTAKATLTQMVNLVFQRMEAQTMTVVPRVGKGPEGPPPAEMQSPKGPAPQPEPATAPPPTEPALPPSLLTPNVSSKNASVPISGVASVTAYIDLFVSSVIDGVLAQFILAKDPSPATAAATASANASATAPSSTSATASSSSSAATAAPSASTSSAASGASAARAPTVTLSDVAAAGSSSESLSTSVAMGEAGDDDDATTMNTRGLTNIFQKDAYLLFRALCKISMKDVGSEPGRESSESMDMRSKVLALELLLSLLENSGPIFRASVDFIETIQKYLCVSLLKNFYSPIPAVFRLSLSIFVMLLVHFKDYLKTAIGVFFTDVFFNFLESPRSTLMQKTMVLKVLSRICTDPQTIVDIFVNYDSDVKSQNIFQRMVENMARLAQLQLPTEPSQLVQEQIQMQIIALQALVFMARSLVEWSRDFKDPDAENLELANAADEAQDLLNEENELMNDHEHGQTGQGSSSSSSQVPASQAPAPAPAPPAMVIENKNLRVAQAGNRRSLSFSSMGSASGGSAGDDPDLFEQRRQYKLDVDRGIRMFNQKPKKGIALLIDKEILKRDAAEIALFLKSTEGLSKEKVGEYLGEADAEHVAVLYAYTDLFDFSSLDFDEALRTYLMAFRLPGEAQKIDRMMEKFAERYVTTNPGTFQSADAAYVLAYAVIMLNTDLYNPNQKNKMTKEQFVKNFQKIGDTERLEAPYLEAIYDRIATNEIKMETAASSGPGAVNANANAAGLQGAGGSGNPASKKRLHLAFLTESEEIVRKSMSIIQKDTGKTDMVYYSSTFTEHAAPMFEVAWCPMLAAFSVLLERSDDIRVISLCIEGFRHAIRISSIFRMEVQRNAFVSSLAKFTFLHSTREMKSKNIEAIKTLITIAHTDGNYLESSWSEILTCVSQLERLHIIGSEIRHELAPGLWDGRSGPTLLGTTDGSAGTGTGSGLPAGASGGAAAGGASASGGASSGSSGLGATASSAAGGSGGNSSNSGRGSNLLNLNVELPKFSIPGLGGSKKPSSGAGGAGGGAGSGTAAAGGGAGGLADTSTPVLQPLGAAGKTVEEVNSLNVVDQIDQLAIDRIFSKSANLNSNAIVEFVAHLCMVSLSEINSQPPRTFSLQKIIEIAYYNMSRIRIVWNRIWGILGNHFRVAGCHSNLNVAMYAVDSLRQLAMKFLEKDELSQFQFQKEFLIPFHHIIQANKTPEIREFVIRCLSHMINQRVSNIKSGWKSVFSVFTIAANDMNESLVFLGFETVERIVREYFSLISDVFIDCVNCIMAYINQQVSAGVSVGAIEQIQFCAAQLADGHVPLAGGDEGHRRHSLAGTVPEPHPSSAVPQTRELLHFTDDPRHVRYWFPVLAGLSGSISDGRVQVRTRALDVLFGILRTYGAMFSPELWTMIYQKVLFPIFDGVLISSKADSEWLKSTCFAALRNIVSLYEAYIHSVGPKLLPMIVELLRSCITQENDNLAKMGVSTLLQLVKSSMPHNSASDWTFLCTSIRNMFAQTMPTSLLEYGELVAQNGTAIAGASAAPPPSSDDGSAGAGGTGGGALGALSPAMPNEDAGQPGQQPGLAGEDRAMRAKFRAIRSKCVVQLVLIQAVNDIIFDLRPNLDNENVKTLLDAIQSSFSFAHQFNNDMALRIALWKAGFMVQLPNLLKQETNGLQCYLRIMFYLYSDTSERFPGRTAYARAEMLQHSEALLDHFISRGLSQLSQSDEKELFALTPTVLTVIEGVAGFTQEQFTAHLPVFYTRFCDLIEIENREIRAALRGLFKTRFAKLIIPATADR